MKNGREISQYTGTVRYYLNGQLHRDSAPAVEYVSGTKMWYQHGKEHREDGAAIEYGFGERYWFLYGKEQPCRTQEEFERLMSLKAFW